MLTHKIVNKFPILKDKDTSNFEIPIPKKLTHSIILIIFALLLILFMLGFLIYRRRRRNRK